LTLDTEVGEILQGAVDALRAAGTRLDEEVHLPSLAEGHDVAQRLIQGSISHTMPDAEFAELAAKASSLGPDDDSPSARWARNISQRAREFNLVLQRRARLMARWAEVFRDHDVVLCPVTPSAAFVHDHSAVDARTVLVSGRPLPYADQFAWLQAIGVAHLPAVVAPVGRTRSGLPVGIQIVGPLLEDRTPIDFAGHLGRLIGGFVAPPTGGLGGWLRKDRIRSDVSEGPTNGRRRSG
jgi:amidase